VANVKNLRPSSPEEARENGRKGGQASAVVRQKKKAMREMAELVLGSPVPVSKSLAKQLEALGFEPTDANIQLLSLLAVAKHATKGDLPALQFLRDTAGEKPADKMNVSQVVSGDFVLEIVGEDDAGDSEGDESDDDETGLDSSEGPTAEV